MTLEQMSGSIEPDSLEYGARDDLEAGLPAAMPQPTAGAAPETGAGAIAFEGPGEDPFELMLGAEEGNNIPITEGLSVGPGAGPAARGLPPLDSMDQRLKLVATGARSPVLRAMARNALRRRLRERSGV